MSTASPPISPPQLTAPKQVGADRSVRLRNLVIVSGFVVAVLAGAIYWLVFRAPTVDMRSADAMKSSFNRISVGLPERERARFDFLTQRRAVEFTASIIALRSAGGTSQYQGMDGPVFLAQLEREFDIEAAEALDQHIARSLDGVLHELDSELAQISKDEEEAISAARGTSWEAKQTEEVSKEASRKSAAAAERAKQRGAEIKATTRVPGFDYGPTW